MGALSNSTTLCSEGTPAPHHPWYLVWPKKGRGGLGSLATFF